MRNNIRVGFSLNGKHTYHDYGLYLSEPPDFGAPEPRLSLVEIPGRDGFLDYTEAATGEVKYSNRQMRLVFATEIRRDKREALRSELWSDLHGQMAEIIYDLDPDWYYTGRCSVTFDGVMDWKMKVVISVDAKPYKLARDLTIFSVAPTSFAAETIFLGKGTEAQHINSIFEFGTRNFPQLDLTQFSALQVRWQDNTAWGSPTYQIVDGDGEVFSDDLDAEVIGSGFYGLDLATSEIAGITKSRVYRILCWGRSLVELYGITTASASVMVPVERMTVVPVWSASAAVTAFVNGRKFAIPAGASQNYDCQLRAGENQVSFIADSTDVAIDLQYRNGRL